MIERKSKTEGVREKVEKKRSETEWKGEKDREKERKVIR